MSIYELRIPDIGDFKDVEIIEVLVKPGEKVDIDQSIITIESDKASMEIPCNKKGIIKELKVNVGDKVSKDSIILLMNVDSENFSSKNDSLRDLTSNNSETDTLDNQILQMSFDTIVLGAGPAGYTAAFRAADLGQKVALIERDQNLGGVCLNVGCIPSKALLHAAKVITDAEEMSKFGIEISKPKIDLTKIRSWKNGIIKKLTDGLTALSKSRRVEIINGIGSFETSESIKVKSNTSTKIIHFKNAIIAAGSSAVKIPNFPYNDERIFDSTGALQLKDIPEKLLIIGGGIIGLEMACVYDALGSKVTIVEFSDRLISIADKDIVKPLFKRIKARYEAIYLNTKVSSLESLPNGILASLEQKNGNLEKKLFDKVLVAVGRKPNGKKISAEKAGVFVNDKGFIPVDKELRTNIKNIFAIGDICGEPMLAHKASSEAKIVAEIISGKKNVFDAVTIPSVAYTDPEVAWMGISEDEAKNKGISYEKSIFPWSASGRALAMGRSEGLTKLIWEPETKKIIGAGITGISAGELLGEIVLAMEMGADLEDLALTVHAHPTLSETPMLAAEIGLGSITDLHVKQK